MSQIFISYSHEDKAYAHKLHRHLINQGFDAWIDDRIDYGSHWTREIEKRLSDCAAFILIMSPNSDKSEWVQNELSFARQLRKPIFPLLLEGNAWWHLGTTQYVDVKGEKLPPAKFFIRLAEIAPRDQDSVSSAKFQSQTLEHKTDNAIDVGGNVSGSNIIVGNNNVIQIIPKLEPANQIDDSTHNAEKAETERNVAEKLAREKQEQENTERIARENAEHEAAEKLAKEKEEKENAEKAARELAQQQAAEKSARAKADREAAEKLAQQKADHDAAEKMAREKEKREQREAAEKARAEELVSSKAKELYEKTNSALQFEWAGDLENALKVYYEILNIDSTYPNVETKINELETAIRVRQENLHREAEELVRRQAIEKAEREKAERDATNKESEQKKTANKLIPNTIGSFSILIIIGYCLIVALINWHPLPSVPVETAAYPALSITTKTSTTHQSPTETLSPESTITQSQTLGIGSSMISPKDGMTLMYVPAGNFTMGSSDFLDTPAHLVTLDAFWIDRTDVTNKMYSLCVNTSVCKPPTNTSSVTHSSYYGNSQFDNYPVIYVTWDMASTYCKWAGRQLPTEAQWEKAARGTDGRTYPWGKDTPNDNLLNYNNTIGDTTEVGKYPNGASPYGVLDMAGNVWQWVADWYAVDYYNNSSSSNPLGPAPGQYRVLRGGSWYYIENSVHSAYRLRLNPDDSYYVIGFRCAMSATP